MPHNINKLFPPPPVAKCEESSGSWETMQTHYIPHFRKVLDTPRLCLFALIIRGKQETQNSWAVRCIVSGKLPDDKPENDYPENEVHGVKSQS